MLGLGGRLASPKTLGHLKDNLSLNDVSCGIGAEVNLRIKLIQIPTERMAIRRDRDILEVCWDSAADWRRRKRSDISKTI